MILPGKWTIWIRATPRRVGLAVAMTVAVVAAGWAPAQAAFPGRTAGSSSTRPGRGSTARACRRSTPSLPTAATCDDSPTWGRTRRRGTPRSRPTRPRIVFVVTAEDSNDQVWIMWADGSHQRPLIDEPDWGDNGPSFTAGGRRVLFSRCGGYVRAVSDVQDRLGPAQRNGHANDRRRVLAPVRPRDVARRLDDRVRQRRRRARGPDLARRRRRHAPATVGRHGVRRADLVVARRHATRVHELPRGRPVHDRRRRDRSAPDRAALVVRGDGRRTARGSCGRSREPRRTWVRTAAHRRRPTGAIPWTSWTPRWASATRIGGSHDETSRAMDGAVPAPRGRDGAGDDGRAAVPRPFGRRSRRPTDASCSRIARIRSAARSTPRTPTAPRSSR